MAGGIPYTRAEDAYLTANNNSLPHRYMANHLGRSVNSVHCRCFRLGLIRTKKRISPKCSQKKLDRMQALIKICETSTSRYKLDVAKQELKKLSGL